ncbi:40S ribosomal protein S15 [Toxocara canis]|uniref:40S ribosomal protein S15 n=1 Tax=Toxocara canis TaxID=6265 RepID=A0A0B2V763_TOXCA|nr:40S ribosomal protein S15 [Toxocara canis]
MSKLPANPLRSIMEKRDFFASWRGLEDAIFLEDFIKVQQLLVLASYSSQALQSGMNAQIFCVPPTTDAKVASELVDGKGGCRVEVKPEMIGHYLGEFSISYKPVKHGRPGIGATHSSRFIPLK